MQASDILDFWFADSRENHATINAQQPLWWGKSDETDRLITDKFSAMVEKALAGDLESWEEEPRSRLALIILLDQFTRTIYRNTHEAFSGDPIALMLAIEGIEQGMDQQLTPIERVFFYMPLEHAEDTDIQEFCVGLFELLAQSVPEQQQKIYQGFYDYAVAHQKIIDRFGRFPHRNEMLDREATEEEEAFLLEPNSSF